MITVVYFKRSFAGVIFVAVYVDDILISGSDPAPIMALKAHLHNLFNIKDLGLMHYFLGIEISYLPSAVAMTQKKFAQELLLDSKLDFSSTSPKTPLPLTLKLFPDVGIPLEDAEYYRCMVGKLNFLSNTRPDLSYTVQTLSQFMQRPCDSHLDALIHTLKS